MKKIALNSVLVLGVLGMMQGCASTHTTANFKQQGYQTREEMENSGKKNKNVTCVVDYENKSWCKQDK